jgi:C4-dicarboxylate-specific signal transduction histidine kinase
MEYRVARVAEEQPRPHSRWTLVCASGEQRTLDWSTVRLESSSGGFQGLLTIGADITDQLKAQKDLQQTQRDLNRLARANLLGELASTLAHELNQPLAAILSNAQAARRFMTSGAFDLNELRDILDDIVSDDKRASEVIRHLRSMLQWGDIPRAAVDVNDAVREVLELLDGELRDNHVSLSAHYSPEMPEVHGARVEIQQIVMNLLMNSLKALHRVPAGDRAIEIRTRADEDGVLVSVSDTGPGIASETLPKIFEAFHSTTEGGIGMGLTICKRIVENHGGEIRAENADAGGAVIAFSLPALG